MTSWEKIEITAPAGIIDILSDFIISMTSRGVEITDQEEVSEQSYCTKLTAWFSEKEMKEGLLEQLRQYAGKLPARFHIDGDKISITHRAIQEENWAEKWKEYFKPVRVGRNFVIKPGWELFDAAADDIVIDIDPGQAFGVGTHASTALMLETMEWLWDQESWQSLLPSVLDVGTGTGILGIAAAKKGASMVNAIDIDPEAIRTAAENAVRNRTHKIMKVDSTPVNEIKGSFNAVLANIDHKTIKIIAEHLVRLLDTVHGILLISGILAEQQKEVIKIFQGSGLRLVRITTGSGAGDTGSGEWCCLVFSKTPGRRV